MCGPRRPPPKQNFYIEHHPDTPSTHPDLDRDQKPTDPPMMSELMDDLLRNLAKHDRYMPQCLHANGRQDYNHQRTDRRAHGGDCRRTWQTYQGNFSQMVQQQPQPGRFQPQKFGPALHLQQPKLVPIPLPIPQDSTKPYSA